MADDSRLSINAREIISSATEIYWSVASLWEIAIKLSLDRPDFRLTPDWATLIPEEMQRNAIRRLEIDPAHCEALSRLPWHHRDPFDRLLIAQAQVEELTVITCDSHFGPYPVSSLW